MIKKYYKVYDRNNRFLRPTPDLREAFRTPGSMNIKVVMFRQPPLVLVINR